MGNAPASRRKSEAVESDAPASEFSPLEADCVFTAYFEGTANIVEKRTTQIGLFHGLDDAIDIYDPASAYHAVLRALHDDDDDDDIHLHPGKARVRKVVRLKMGLNGCGAENGLAGVVFAYGMQAQCDAVAAAVRATRCALGDEATLQLNLAGLSRGAVSALAVTSMFARSPDLFFGAEAKTYDPSLRSLAEHEEAARAEAKNNDLFALWTSHQESLAKTVSGFTTTSSKAAAAAKKAVEDEAAAGEVGPRRVRVIVPEGMAPGQIASFKIDDRSLRAAIPAKAKPGTMFEVVVPPTKEEEEAAALTRAAKAAPKRRTRLHLLLFDPVPGNQIVTTSMLDPLGYTTANLGMDVSDCAALRRVLAIYPYEPLPAITFHAPLVPKYPMTTHVDEVASLGCHQGAMLCTPNRISCSFLVDECGIALRPCRPFDILLQSDSSTLRVLEMLRVAAIDDAKKHGAEVNSRFVVRDAHATMAGVAVIRHANGVYLNAFHHHLSMSQSETFDEEERQGGKLGGSEPLYLLDVVRPRALPRSSSRA